MQKYATFDYALDGGVAVVTFSRPERRNAFTLEVLAEMLDLFDRTDADDAVRGVVFTGAGGAFCVGADLGGSAPTFDQRGQAGHGGEDAADLRRDGGGRLALRIFCSLKPVVAAVNGPAVGIGATMTLPMDRRIAGTDARFGFVFSRRGITPEACSSWFLPRLVGMPTALDWLYSGRVFAAEEALAAGLVQSLHPPGELVDAAIAKLRDMTCSSAPVSIALIRQMVWQGLAAPHPMDSHRIESRTFQARGGSADAREGIGAFLQKRAASFPDRVSDGLPEGFPWRDEPPFD